MWFVILILIAAFLRIFTLGNLSFWLDEAASSMLARAEWRTFLFALFRRQANMTLYYFLLRGWMHFGQSEAFARSLSVIFGLAALPAMYCFAAHAFNHKTARIAALLIAIHQFHVQYSQQARGYSLVVLLALSSCYFFVRIQSGAGRKIWTAYLVTTVLLVYAHVFGTWIFLTQSLFALAHPQMRAIRKRYLATAGAVLLLISPLAITLLLFSSRSQLSWISQSSAAALHRLILDFSGSPASPLVILEILLILGSLFFSLSEPASGGRSVSYVFTWLWLLLPCTAMALASLRWPILQSRYLIVCLPPFLLLIADGVVRIRKRVVSIAALMAVVGYLLIGVVLYLQQRKSVNQSDDWRDAVYHIISEASVGDVVVFPYSAEQIPFREYAHRFTGPNQQLVLIPEETDSNLLSTAGYWLNPEVASKVANRSRRIWVISALQANDAGRRVQAELDRKLRESSSQHFGFVTTRLFVRQDQLVSR